MKLTFWGAAKEVTGSKHLLEVNGKKYLLDCGMYQGQSSEELQMKNREFLIAPEKIDTILLSHAHIDHSGLLPYFVKNGFQGKIYTTLATRDLCSFMLMDSAHIQEIDYKYAKRHHIKEEEEFGEPLYITDDVPAVMNRFIGINYNTEHVIDENITVIFRDAGHVLGSSFMEIKVSENKQTKHLIFTGDLGRKGLPILRDPMYAAKADFIIIESTYGGRLHDPVEDMKKDVEEVIKKVLKRKGKIIIPAFSLERTQEMIYLLHLLLSEKKIPEIPIYIDSPLSYNITQVFQMHPEAYDQETFKDFLMNQSNPFSFSKLKFTQSVEESKALNEIQETCIIISSSGMCEAGRIRHHIANNIENEKNLILIIGYQAEGTLGRRLVEKEKSIKVLGIEYSVRAEIQVLNSFSDHADKNDLMDWLSHVKEVQKLFIVHGEETQMIPLKEEIKKTLKIPEIIVPECGEEYAI